MKIILTLVSILFVSLGCAAQSCSSSISANDGWRTIKTAPRDGTVVELAETYGVAPWYGLFSWKFAETSYKGIDGKEHVFVWPKKSWVKVGDESFGVSEDECLFWRPYKKKVESYRDPTGGRQDSVKYWCDAIGVAYDKKKDACVK